jgi:hypothetical protein
MPEGEVEYHVSLFANKVSVDNKLMLGWFLKSNDAPF